jgi:DNA-binding transcriptional LysR family regulator
MPEPASILNAEAEIQDKLTSRRLLLDWRRVRQFLYAYERGSIGQAAQELNVTQPALSKSLRSLEQDLQVKLFERTPLGVVPTVFGEALALHAKAIQSELRNAQNQIEYMRGATRGHVTVGIGPSMAPHLMPTASLRLLEERPGIKLTVREGMASDLIPALRTGEIDLALGAWPHLDEPDLGLEVIYRDQLLVYAGVGHPLAGQDVHLARLLDYPWALPPREQAWRRRLDEVLMSKGLQPLVAGVESNSSTYLKSLLAGNRFLTFLPRQSLMREEQLGLVAPLKCPDLTLETDLIMAHRERAVLSPATRMLMTHLRAIGDELAQGVAPARAA